MGQQQQQQQQSIEHASGVKGGALAESVANGPTRSLWIGNLPPNVSTYTLQAIFSPYRPVESVRILTHKQCGFVNFHSLESAIQARSVLDGKELFPGAGPCRIGFAKVLTPQQLERSHSSSPELSSGTRKHSSDEGASFITTTGGIEYTITERDPGEDSPQRDHYGSSATVNSGNDSAPVVNSPPSIADIAEELGTIVRELGSDDKEAAIIVESINRAANYKDFKEIPQQATNVTKNAATNSNASAERVYDASALREVRKKIDSGSCTQDEIEEIALDLLDEIAELSSDYVGNTVVQKLFDSCSEPVKQLMLDRVAPSLAQIGIHKNGTWAAQKIIDVAGTKKQIQLIGESLHPYLVQLFLDQFGNYVAQCCLKFGAPWDDFIFETMLSQFWEIAQGRFGARAMRACLESQYVTKFQQRMLGAAIAEYAVYLATNANGALLLTWFLDTCTLPNRHNILSPKLVPHLVHLGTHKLASLTVLKVLNNKSESKARQIIVDALFSPQQDMPGSVLEAILRDGIHGPNFIYKVISTPVLEPHERQNAIFKVRQALMNIKALPNQGYKRLMDEIGLSTRASNAANAAVVGNITGHTAPMPINGQQAPLATALPRSNNYQAPVKQRQIGLGGFNSAPIPSQRSPGAVGHAGFYGPHGTAYGAYGSEFSQPILSSVDHAKQHPLNTTYDTMGVQQQFSQMSLDAPYVSTVGGGYPAPPGGYYSTVSTASSYGFENGRGSDPMVSGIPPFSTASESRD
jgi:protein JSN1